MNSSTGLKKSAIVTTLYSKRLVIRPLTLDDAVFIRRLYNTEGFLRYVGDKNIRSVDDAGNYLASGPIAMYREHGIGLCLVALKQGDTPMGICGLIKRDYLQDVDLGFGFLPEYEGQGYALEAATAILQHARQTGPFQRVVAIATPDNHRSVSLLQRLGFRLESHMKSPTTHETLALYSISL